MMRHESMPRSRAGSAPGRRCCGGTDASADRPARDLGRRSARSFSRTGRCAAGSGFEVVTPLLLDGGRAAVLVERGWVPRNFEHREQLPASARRRRARRRCEAALPRRRPSSMSSAGRTAGRSGKISTWPASVPKRDCPLLELAVRQTGDASDGMLREWHEPGSGAENNYGYAFQWWAMSAATASSMSGSSSSPPAAESRMLDEPLGLTVYSLPAATGSSGGGQPPHQGGPAEDDRGAGSCARRPSSPRISVIT